MYRLLTNIDKERAIVLESFVNAKQVQLLPAFYAHGNNKGKPLPSHLAIYCKDNNEIVKAVWKILSKTSQITNAKFKFSEVESSPESCLITSSYFVSYPMQLTANLKRAVHWLNAQNWQDEFRGDLANKLSSQYLNQFFMFASMAVSPLTNTEIIQILLFCTTFVGNESDSRIVNNLLDKTYK